MTPQNELKQQILATLNTLPEETLEEVATFLGYVRYKLKRDASQPTPYKPVALGGLWAGITIPDEDIAEVRRDW